MRKPKAGQVTEICALQEALKSRTRERDTAQVMLHKKESEVIALIEKLDQRESAAANGCSSMLAQRTSEMIATTAKLGVRENQLDVSNSELARRTQELEKINEELSLVMQQREDFVAALSHDLKNPLISGSRVQPCVSINNCFDSGCYMFDRTIFCAICVCTGPEC